MTAVNSDALGFQSIETNVAAATAKPKRRAPLVLGGLTLVAAIAAGTYYAHGAGRESTDDAQLEGHVMGVSARISGQVARVLVKDNQVVHEGDVLAELDRSDLDAKADAARADLAAAKAQLDSARAQLALTGRTIDASITQAKGGLTQAASALTSSRAVIAQNEADVDAARARFSLSESDLGRANRLHGEGAVARAEVDKVQARFDEARAELTQAESRLAAARASTHGSAGGIVFAQGRLAQAQTGPEQLDAARAAVALAEARVKQNEAAVRLAELNVSFAAIRAPHGGVVSRRTVEAGQMVGPDRPLLAIVPLDDVWVVANFKEDQLRGMHDGQPVSIEIDTYGRKTFHGHVDSIAGASGARFALLPPDNATGNFVKVVQRIPVLIRFDGDRAEFRPGMSATVTVDTRVGG